MIDHYLRVYARQEYLTPGAPESVALIVEALGSDRTGLVLEIACGKGEAACEVVGRTGCRVIAVDRHEPFLRYVHAKLRARGLDGAVQLVRADGRQLPLPDSTFEAGYCIGAPSLVGLEPCLRELHRAVRPSAPVIISDVYWHRQPSGALGPEWGWPAEDTRRLSLDGYHGMLRECGLDVERTYVHPLRAWDAYLEPMRSVAAEERARGETAFADEMASAIAVDRRAAETFVTYATFVTRNRGGA